MPANLGQEFPQRNDIVYLNHAGVAPWPLRAALAVECFAQENVAQGATNYPQWLAVEAHLRERLHALLNAESIDDIALVKNTSEALSVVAYGLDWRPDDNIVIGDQEFPSNRIVWESLAALGVQVRKAVLAADSEAVPEAALMALVDQRTRLLAVSSVQYGTGLRMDLERLGRFCRDQGIWYCVDAIQSVGALVTDVQAIQADFLMADGHKWMLGPEGLGVFYTHPASRDKLKLSQYGWHMVQHLGDFERQDWEAARSARRFECGSPNMLGIMALDASLSLLLEVGMGEVQARVLANAAYLIERIRAMPQLDLITDCAPQRHAGIVTFRSRHVDDRTLFRQLMERGIICAQRAGGIRFSPHFYTSRERLDQAVDAIERALTLA